MGRSFIIRTENEKLIQLDELLQTMQNLPEFSINFNQIKIFDKKVYFGFYVPEPENHNIFVTRLTSGSYMIESRALEGEAISRQLFLAVTCAIAILTDGKANSADGAWHNPDKFYSGQELWEEFCQEERKISFSSI